MGIVLGMLNFFFTYLYYIEGKYLLAIVWAITGTLNIIMGVMMYERRQ